MRQFRTGRPGTITEGALLAHYYRIAKDIQRAVPPAVVRYRKSPGSYARCDFEWVPVGVSGTMMIRRAVITISPMFRHHPKLALRELVHEMGHVLAMRHSDRTQAQAHGPRFQRAMRLMVRAGIFDSRDLW